MAGKTSASDIKSSHGIPSRASVEDLALRLDPYSRYYQKITDKSPRFVLLLGAGASKESGIPLAGEMIRDFVNIICDIKCPENTSNKEKEAWLKAHDYYKDEKNKYSSLFEKCFPTEVERREYIEEMIDGKVPSLGYIALAHLIKNKIIDTIITTNFDDLVYQACTSFTDIRPTVFSLGGFASDISSTIKHARVLKIHGDFMFSKLVNIDEESVETDPNMTEQVRKILTDCKGLFVVGYKGNDKSVMDLLKEIPVGTYLYWCVYNDNSVNAEIAELLSERHRFTVKTEGFDNLMMEICKVAGIEYNKLVSSSSDRIMDLCGKLTSFGLKQPAIIPSEEQQQEKSLNRQLGKIRSSFGVLEYFVLGNKAYFNKNYREAEKFYHKAIIEKPNEADAHFNYAKVLSEDASRFSEAENAFLETIRLNPMDVSAHNRYANLLAKDKTKAGKAVIFYKKAIDLDPDYFFAHFEYGNFLAKHKLFYGKAEKHYRKALEIDPDFVQTYYNLAVVLLEDVSQRVEAKTLLKKAIKLKPDFAGAYYQYAKSLKEDGESQTEFDFKEIYSKYREQFFEYFLESAVKFKTDGDEFNTKKFGEKAGGTVFENEYYKFAQAYSVLDEKDAAFYYLKKALRDDFSKRALAKQDPIFQWIADDSRFGEIVGE